MRASFSSSHFDISRTQYMLIEGAVAGSQASQNDREHRASETAEHDERGAE